METMVHTVVYLAILVTGTVANSVLYLTIFVIGTGIHTVLRTAFPVMGTGDPLFSVYSYLCPGHGGSESPVYNFSVV